MFMKRPVVEQGDHCCMLMARYLQDGRINIGYLKKFREYYIPLHDPMIIQCIVYCPWCGTKLPKSLRDEYFNILKKEYDVTDDLDPAQIKRIPEEFKTDV